MPTISQDLSSFLKVNKHDSPVSFEVLNEHVEPEYTRLLIRYQGTEGDWIPAYFFIPASPAPFPAILVHHQHNGERHLGKSEVAGLVGNPLQAFGPALAARGIAVLAPDSICFEDRRHIKTGTAPDTGESDWLQHYNEMSYRLVKGDTLMRKVLDDASVGLSLLYYHQNVIKDHIGVMGHSYGGNTSLFQAAIDQRVAYACSSGALCSYQRKFADNTGLEMALVIPGFYTRFDMTEVVRAISPRPLLIVSADEDEYSKDADVIVESVKSYFQNNKQCALKHLRYHGSHAVTQEKFNDIINWICVKSCNK